MENVLDFYVTEEEMNKYFGLLKTSEGRKEYLKKVSINKVAAYTDLAILFNMRGDISKKEYYLGKLRDISPSCELSARLRIGGF